jgi:MFS family permease
MQTVILLGLVSLLTDISSEMVYPLLSLYLTTTLGATPAIVGVIEGIAESLASLLKVYSGYLSDKMQKRKPLAILGYGAATVGKLFLYLSGSWGWVLAGRVVDRFGKGVRTAPRDALIAEASRSGQLGHSFGLHRALDTLGAVIGIGIAYVLFTGTHGNYTRIFLIATIPGIFGLLLLFAVREKRPGKYGARIKPLAGWRTLHPRLKAFLWVTLIFTLGNSSNQFLLLRAADLGFKPADVILAYLLFNVMYALVSYPAGRLSDRIGSAPGSGVSVLWPGLSGVFPGFCRTAYLDSVCGLRALQRVDRGGGKSPCCGTVSRAEPCNPAGHSCHDRRNRPSSGIDHRRIALENDRTFRNVLFRLCDGNPGRDRHVSRGSEACFRRASLR